MSNLQFFENYFSDVFVCGSDWYARRGDLLYFRVDPSRNEILTGMSQYYIDTKGIYGLLQAVKYKSILVEQTVLIVNMGQCYSEHFLASQ
jgi:hypothetical protein